MLLKKYNRMLRKGLPMLLIAGSIQLANAGHLSGTPATYTLDADFDDGSLINVVHSPSDQLQLSDKTTAFNFIWVAASSRGTVVKIDTLTGDILGEYRTAPSGQGLNPSRTTVDLNGNVWVGNRNEFGFVNQDTIALGVPASSRSMGSVVRIGLVENGQCEDRNNNGTIETSTGLADIKGWSNAGLVDTLGGVSTADDECIINYTRVNATGTRHVSVDGNNDVWVSGTGAQLFDLLDGVTGQITRQEPSVGFGGYGGLIDPNGVIWSARSLLRWDTLLTLTGPNGGNWDGYFHDSYGLCIDSLGNVWNTQLSGNLIRKFSSAGVPIGTFSHGNFNAQGCVVDGNDDVWVAHSLIGGTTTVGHLLNDGTYVGNVTLPGGNGPTGVSVDGAGKIWAANINSNNVSRIDPSLGPIGADLVTPIGAVDLTVDLGAGAGPYNYSDMTGSLLFGAPDNGTWSIIHDTGQVGIEWGIVSWNSDEPGDSSILVTAASSADGTIFGPAENVSNGSDLSVTDGQYLKVIVSFTRDSINGETPILFDLTLENNRAPDCSLAGPSVDSLWPPNHKFVDIDILGVTDPDGDVISILIDSIRQDEPVDTFGDGKFTPDGVGVGTDIASVRAERSGNKKVPGNGRVYHIDFTADDGNGKSCSGSVTTGVPHDQGKQKVPVDDGPLFDSTSL
jgi:streptogramin lyase